MLMCKPGEDVSLVWEDGREVSEEREAGEESHQAGQRRQHAHHLHPPILLPSTTRRGHCKTEQLRF